MSVYIPSANFPRIGTIFPELLDVPDLLVFVPIPMVVQRRKLESFLPCCPHGARMVPGTPRPTLLVALLSLLIARQRNTFRGWRVSAKQRRL